MKVIEAVYENGVFRPLVRVDLPEHTPAQVNVNVPESASGEESDVYRILSRTYETGDPSASARHDEHEL